VTGILTPDRHAAIVVLGVLLAAALASYAATWAAALALRIPGRLLAVRRLRNMPPFASASRVSFVTEDAGRRFFLTAGRPLQLRITRPAPVSVTAALLPFPVRRGDGTLFVVEEFRDDGWVISGQVPGVMVEGWLCWEAAGPRTGSYSPSAG
jgi:hypothetical protein